MVRFSLAAACLVLVAAGPAAAQPGLSRAVCKDDVAKLCADIQPGAGRIVECLKAHGDQVSEGCRTAMTEAMAARRAQKESGEAPPASTPGVPPPPPPPP